MSLRTGSLDWRRAEDYDWLAHLPRTALAWEWLRRQAPYRQAWRQSLILSPLLAGQISRKWSLHAFEDPVLDAREARPIWRREVAPFVIQATVEHFGPSPDAIDLRRFLPLMNWIEEAGLFRLAILEGGRGIRIDVAGSEWQDGEVTLSYRLHGLGALSSQLLALRQLQSLAQSGRFSPPLHEPETRFRRMILLLRAFDGVAAGANQREIAAALLGCEAIKPRWRASSPSVRAQAQRLVRGARAMADGKFWDLLSSA